MTTEDVTFARSLTDIEQWGHLEEDFQRFVEVNPGGCFVAWERSERLGIVTSVVHGDYAFLGNLIVAKEARARGVGMLLMKRVIDILDRKGVTTIELDGVFRAVEAYRMLGFRDKYLSLRFMRPVSKGACIKGEPTICRTPDISSILRFDRERLGMDRSMFLRHLIGAHPDATPAVVGRQGMSAYGVVRIRATGTVHIGPLVAGDTESASALLSSICAEHGKCDLTIGVPCINTSAIGIVLEHGFCHRPPSLRMYRGAIKDYEDSVYGIISADVG
ncbi:MAG: GNAT family N-acetyltransferase [candidate division WOR-3 bacterium]|nr:MAG: GNAT family N-acetyltransferase [candidate division WOR-3 bacterium]